MQDMRKYWNRIKDSDLSEKKVLMVISTLNTGGAQRIFSNMMMAFPEEYHVDIMLNDTENIVFPYKGTIIDLGMKPQSDKTKVSYQIQAFWKRFRKLRQLKRQNHYTACISALTSANAANILTKDKHCKVIVSEHSYMSEDSCTGIRKWLIRSAIRFFYNRADQIVTVSKGIEKDMVEHFRVKQDKVVTIYNGYSINEIKNMSQESLSAEEKSWFAVGGPALVTVGRLTRAKGQWHLIRALQKIREAVPEMRLFILGEGELEGELKKLAKDLQLEDAVVFCGFRKNPYRVMKACDIFILPSLYEGFGNVIIESFCCGLPCISADFNVGAREIMAPETDMDYRRHDGIEQAEYGILCPVCDGVIRGADEKLTPEEETLAAAVVEVATNEAIKLAYREKGWKRAKDFDMQHLIRKWLEVIED